MREGLDAAGRSRPSRYTGNKVLRGGRYTKESAMSLASSQLIVFLPRLGTRFIVIGVYEGIDRWIALVNRLDGFLYYFRGRHFHVLDIGGQIDRAYVLVANHRNLLRSSKPSKQSAYLPGYDRGHEALRPVPPPWNMTAELTLRARRRCSRRARSHQRHRSWPSCREPDRRPDKRRARPGRT